MLEIINVQLYSIVFMLLNFISLSLLQLGINQLFMGRLDLGVRAFTMGFQSEAMVREESYSKKIPAL